MEDPTSVERSMQVAKVIADKVNKDAIYQEMLKCKSKADKYSESIRRHGLCMKARDMVSNLIYYFNPNPNSKPPENRFLKLEGKLIHTRNELKDLTKKYLMCTDRD